MKKTTTIQRRILHRVIPAVVGMLLILTAVNTWQQNDEQKKNVVSAVFDSLEASGATTITELNTNRWVTFNAILKAAGSIAPETYGEIADSLKKLAAAGKDVLWDEAKKTFERFDPAKIIMAESNEAD